MLHLIKKLIMTIHTHPFLEGPLVFLPVPTPSFRDQLKLKHTLLEIALNSPALSRIGNTLSYLTPAKIIEKLPPKAER